MADVSMLNDAGGDAKRLLSLSGGSLSLPLELKLLGGLLLLLLFLLFLILVLWDRYGQEISELYTGASTRDGAPGTPATSLLLLLLLLRCWCIADKLVHGVAAVDTNVNAVADEYTVYQKLPTFFYEYMPRSRPKKD